MNKYRVQQKATKWYETTVEANSESEAIELASQKLMSDGGTEVVDSFTWEDEFWTERENN